jgi:hypothetical protein
MCDRTLTGLKKLSVERGPVSWSVEPAAKRDFGREAYFGRLSNRINVELVEHQPCAMTLCPGFR